MTGALRVRSATVRDTQPSARIPPTIAATRIMFVVVTNGAPSRADEDMLPPAIGGKSEIDIGIARDGAVGIGEGGGVSAADTTCVMVTGGSTASTLTCNMAVATEADIASRDSVAVTAASAAVGGGLIVAVTRTLAAVMASVTSSDVTPPPRCAARLLLYATLSKADTLPRSTVVKTTTRSRRVPGGTSGGADGDERISVGDGAVGGHGGDGGMDGCAGTEALGGGRNGGGGDGKGSGDDGDGGGAGEDSGKDGAGGGGSEGSGKEGGRGDSKGNEGEGGDGEGGEDGGSVRKGGGGGCS